MMLDFSRCRLTPFAHQREDVQALIDHPWFFVASEMRTGKSKIVVDAAQYLFEMNIIDRMIIIAPAPVRDVWFSDDFGELKKHLWLDTKAEIREFHARNRLWTNGTIESTDRRLQVLISNYEFLRAKARLNQLLLFATPKTLLVLDESALIKNWEAQQTKACRILRAQCGRVVLLNGTPIFHSPMDLFAQGNMLHHSVLDCKYITQYKARYALQEPILGYGGKPLTDPRGKAIQKVSGWTNLEDLRKRFAPVTVRRLQKECLDLPPKLDTVILTAELSTSWPAYKEMRDNLVVWLRSNVATASTAAIKALRLAQITSGFLGGIEDANVGDAPVDDEIVDTEWDYADLMREIDGEQTTTFAGHERVVRQSTSEDAERPQRQARNLLESNTINRQSDDTTGRLRSSAGVQEIGREKLDILFWLLDKLLVSDPNLHVVVWCRWRAELTRVLKEVAERYPQFNLGTIHGGQKKADRTAALRLLHPDTSPEGPTFVGGTAGTGSFGLNFTAAHTCITMSSGYSPGQSSQMLDRVYGPGQTQAIAYYAILATGPKGQKTIDAVIEAARRNGENLASWTAEAWIKTLKDEG